jgi:putative tryptophan/tyrosine transport system substrate-binding protein
MATRAQRPGMAVVGFLSSTSPEAFASSVAGFRGGLNETGYAEGRNLSIEYRWAENQFNRLPALAAELVRLQVMVIAAVSGSDAAQAAKAATSTIPIVFNIGNDPVRTGLVASLNKPGGNITGITALTRELQGKRLEILREVSDTSLVATFVNPASAIAESNLLDLQTAARITGQQHLVLKTSLDFHGTELT